MTRGTSTPAYGRAQRLIEHAAIASFSVLAGFGLWRLVHDSCARTSLLLLAAVPCGWLAADALSGLVHFALDTFGDVTTPLIGRAFIRPFREHHADATAMTRHDFVETHGASCLVAAPVLAAVCFAPVDAVPAFLRAVLWSAALGALATNQCHKWAHMEEEATPRLVRIAQRWRLALPGEHHRRHHTPPFDSHFCMTCGWMNPLFDAVLRAWR